MSNDLLAAVLAIKETVTRVETKVDAMSTLDERVTTLERKSEVLNGQIQFAVLVLGTAWVILLAWINGLGNWFVQHFQVRMRGCGIQEIIKFFHILSMVPLIAGETVEPLFQNRIAPIPEHRRET